MKSTMSVSRNDETKDVRKLVGQEVQEVHSSDGLSAGFIHQQGQTLKKAIKKSSTI